MDNEALLVAVAAGAASGVSIGGVLKIFLEQAIEKSIAHQYEKRIEDHKLENTLLEKRFDSLKEAIDGLAALVVEISADLEEFTPTRSEEYSKLLIQDFHPRYRRRFQIIRSKFEITNELISSYSLRFNDLLHHNEIGELTRPLKKPGEIRYVYRRVWSLVLESLTALSRICASDKRFWHSGYFSRADEWASRDTDSIKKFLIDSTFGPGRDSPMRFLLSLEAPGGPEAFWHGLHSEVDDRPPALTGAPISK